MFDFIKKLTNRMLDFIKKFFTDIGYIESYRDKIIETGNNIYFKIQSYIEFPPIFNITHMKMLWKEKRLTPRYEIITDNIGRRWLRWKGKYHYTKEFIEYLASLYPYIAEHYTFRECVEIVIIYFKYFYSHVVGNVYHADVKYSKQFDASSVHKRYVYWKDYSLFRLYNVRDIAHEVRFNDKLWDPEVYYVDWSTHPKWGERYYQRSWVELKDGSQFFIHQWYKDRRFIMQDLPDIFYDLKCYIHNLFYIGFVKDPFCTKVVVVFFLLGFLSKIICGLYRFLLNLNNKINSVNQSIKNFNNTINELYFYRIRKKKLKYKLNRFINKNKLIIKILDLYDEFFYYFYLFDIYVLVPIISKLTQLFYFILFCAENYLKFYNFYFSFYYNVYVMLNIPLNLFFYYLVYLPKYHTARLYKEACLYSEMKYNFDLNDKVELFFICVGWYYFWKYIKFRVWLTDIANLVEWLKGISESVFWETYFSDRGQYKIPILFVIYVLIYLILV